MTPPPSPRGYLTGVLCGLVLAVVLAFVNFMGFSELAGWNMEGGRYGCPAARTFATIELLLSAGLAALAWFLLFRWPGGSFGRHFLKGLVGAVTAFFLIPWPCSLTGLTVATFLNCR
ncbi:MAG TPA: hypothetical protein VMA36_17125 [Candidatus Limnocylindria bacterium]|nr:hypothetical protein [Candidatus Limnocylindria bacterium]